MSADEAVKRYVVLDRDGTLIESHHYLSDPDQVRLLPGVTAGLRRLREMNLGLVVTTNQSAVGRGLFNLARLGEIHARFESLLAAAGIRLDGLYSCPHRPEDACDCRKPRIGLLDRASSELDFLPRESFVIGDNVCDIEMGKACGAVTFLVRTGYGAQIVREGGVSPDHVVDDLVEAADIIRGILEKAGERIA